MPERPTLHARYDPTTIETALHALRDDPAWQTMPVSAQAFVLAFHCETAHLTKDNKRAVYDTWMNALPRYAAEGDHHRV